MGSARAVWHPDWPELGLVGVSTRGASAGQHLLLVPDVPWTLFLEPPWLNFNFAHYRFGGDNPLLWEEMAQEVCAVLQVEWLEEGSAEEIQLERELFGEREAYSAESARLRRRHSIGSLAVRLRMRDVWPSDLSREEFEIHRLAKREESVKEIAARRALTVQTVEAYLARISLKMAR